MRLLLSFLLLAATAGAASAATLVDASSVTQVDAQLPKARLRVVNLWATWCVPCVAEMADLRLIDQRYPDGDVAILGVSMDDVIPGDRSETRAKVVRFLDQRKIGWRNVFYTGKATALQDRFRFEGEIPITIVLDSKGREVARHQGQIDRVELMRVLDRLLAKH